MKSDVIDLPEFLERVQDDKALLLELLDIYEQDFIQKRQYLSEAAQQKDYERIKEIAHSLKGASGNISAKNLRPLFSSLEEMGKTGNVSTVEATLSQIDQEFALLKVRMDQLRQELK